MDLLTEKQKKAIAWLHILKDFYSNSVEELQTSLDVAISSIMNLANINSWIYCGDGNNMPPEHDSIYAKLKGTKEWHDGMYEKESDYVQATVEYFDGTRTVSHLRTKDGKWNNLGITTIKVIAWKPMSSVYEEDREGK